MTVRALAGTALVVGLTLAQQPDSLKPQPAPPDSSPKPDTVRPYRPARSPGTAVLLSFLLPGGGQVYTGKWWKALLIAPAELGLGYAAYRAHRNLVDFQRNDAVLEQRRQVYARRREVRDVLLFLTGAVLAYSMGDAYVSAQMYGFDRETRLAGRFAIDDLRLTIVDSGHPALGLRAGIAMQF